MNVVFFGSSHYVIPLIEALHKNFNLALVVTTEQHPTDAVPAYCKQHHIPYLSIHRFTDEVIHRIKECNAPVAVLAYFGVILPHSVLTLFPQGIINSHPSLLPKYRGPTPVQTQILQGETETGVTIIDLDEAVDHGPILVQAKEPILAADTTHSLHTRLFTISADIITKLIQTMQEKTPKKIEQQHAEATHTKPLTRNSGYIDFDTPPTAHMIDRMIRAYYPWPGVWFRTLLEGKEKIIKLLPEQKIQVEGKKPMSYKDFINGYSSGKNILKQLGLI